MRKSTGSSFLVEDFIAQANNRLNLSLGKQEKEKDHLLSTIDQAYNHVLSKAGSELSTEVMTTLEELYMMAKDGIKAMVTSARISHEEDDRVFEAASWTLRDELKDHLIQKIREERREATDLKAELVTTGDDSDYRKASFLWSPKWCCYS
ncbi:hypothetical protein NM208_g14172 [Fusarium decemcellulare]|uniref:Uncharacterized protein n=1 Tax=Fusarium decemcellulare TaxID=57161 RepID=A0ACC1RHN5_9HYPO|nr:hypothetical protein NM208_g14172 [Fusarium decemcellulare]